MSKISTVNGTRPLTVRVSLEDLQAIDDWCRAFPQIPTRGEFLRLALKEKLERDASRKQVRITHIVGENISIKH
jgi:hypothetical protein